MPSPYPTVYPRRTLECREHSPPNPRVITATAHSKSSYRALIGRAVLAATRKHFPLTPLAYGLILLHCWILFLGAHYTYAELNTFRFIRDLFGWQRNNYDKLGHFAQGFVPAIIAREILLRRSAVTDAVGSICS